MTNLMDHLWLDAFAALIFGAVAIVLMGLGYLFIDHFMLKKVDLQKGVDENRLSAAVVSSAILLGIALVVATVFHGVLR